MYRNIAKPFSLSLADSMSTSLKQIWKIQSLIVENSQECFQKPRCFRYLANITCPSYFLVWMQDELKQTIFIFCITLKRRLADLAFLLAELLQC